MAPRETENNAYANFGVTNKEHYGMLWYCLEWSIVKLPDEMCACHTKRVGENISFLQLKKFAEVLLTVLSF